MGMLTKGEIIRAQANDQFCSDIIDYLTTGHLPPSSRRANRILKREQDYIVLDHILYNLWQPYVKRLDEICVRLVVPKSLQNTVLHNMHNSTVGWNV